MIEMARNAEATKSRAEIIARRFEYHKASSATTAKHHLVSEVCTELAKHLINTTLESREQSIALTKLDELRMYWNQAVAFDGQGFDPANR